MPVPLQCPQCSKKLNVPDKYRGKAIKCPGCQKALRVPGGETAGDRKSAAVTKTPPPRTTATKSTTAKSTTAKSTAATKTPPAAAKAKAAAKPGSAKPGSAKPGSAKSGSAKSGSAEANKPAGSASGVSRRQTAKRAPQFEDTDFLTDDSQNSDADFLADMNFDASLSDADIQICPRCATVIPDEARNVCPNCGHNTGTGQLDEAVRRKRAMGGVDPSAFYKQALPDAWAFFKRDKKMATRTTLVWAVFGTLAFIFWTCLQNSERGPIVAFFRFLTALATCAVGGWYWFLSGLIVNVTMQKEDRIKRFHVDAFNTLALGVRSALWPVVTSAPLFLLIGLYWFLTDDASTAKWAAVGLWLATYTLFPIAQIHMASRYTYRASVLWELLKAVPANFGQLLFWNLIALVGLGPFAALFWALETYGGGGNLFRNEHLYGWAASASEWLNGFLGPVETDPEKAGFLYKLVREALSALFTLICLLVIAGLASIPAVMLMRVTGLFGQLRKTKLNLLTKTHRGSPAGFWVRYVAGTTDLVAIPFAALVAAREKSITMLALMLSVVSILAFFGVPGFLAAMGPILWPVTGVFLMWNYFAVLESGSARATIGKENMRLVAETEDGEQKSLGKASTHWLMSTLLLPAFPLVMFDKSGRSLGDRFSKCRVVWKGDD